MQASSADETKVSTSLFEASSSVDQGPPKLVLVDGPQAEPSSGVHRTQSSLHRETDSPLKQRPEKRKRSRVTPEQLAELEREFAINRTPTGAQRKAISERLGMQERQTQIWFQNRRAKAKHQEARPPSPGRTKSAGVHLESYIAQLIREKEPVTLIPCSDLKIGHWTRINPSTLHHEVLAYTSQSRQCIAWFIRSSGLSFKIEVPFTIIKNAQLLDVRSPQLVTLVLELNSIPSFFVQQPDVRPRPGENMSDVRKRIGIAPHLPLPNIGATPGEWVASNDWTQNQQASRVLRHELTGPRTSIIPGIGSFPKEFGLLQDEVLSTLQVPSSNFDPLSQHGDGMPPYDRNSASPSALWNEPHQLPSAHTPSSYSDVSSQWSSSSYVSSAPSAHSAASSTRATPSIDIGFSELNIGPDVSSNIAQPVPVRAHLRNLSMSSDIPQIQSQQEPVLLTGSIQPDLGYNLFPSADDSSQRLLHQSILGRPSQDFGHNFNFAQSQVQGQTTNPSLFSGLQDHDQRATGSSISANSAELLSSSDIGLSHSDINLSQFAREHQQHERKLSEALMAQQGGSQQSPYLELGLPSDQISFYGGQDFPQSSGVGTVNIGFEINTACHSTHNQGVSSFTQGAGFDDSQLFLQQTVATDPAYTPVTGISPNALSGTPYGIDQFTASSHTQGQQSSLLPGSGPNSRRSSTYGFQ